MPDRMSPSCAADPTPMTRMVHDSRTREYVTKRTQEGHSYREIRKSLKRYIARTLYRQLNTLYATARQADSTLPAQPLIE